MPWLAHDGIARCMTSRHLGAPDAIADLFVSAEFGDRELMAKRVAGDVKQLREPLIDWGSALGYARLWLPNEVVTLDVSEQSLLFGTKCGMCQTEWSDESLAFWRSSRDHGAFPSFCWVCGALMPQWRECSTAAIGA
jgi:hypothetical protein